MPNSFRNSVVINANTSMFLLLSNELLLYFISYMYPYFSPNNGEQFSDVYRLILHSYPPSKSMQCPVKINK